MAKGNFRQPPQLDINSGNISENFRRWRRKVEVYLAASGATAKEKQIQTAIILNCAGNDVLEVYENFTWNEERDKDDPEKFLEALEKYCNPGDNEVMESHRFWNIEYQEPFDKLFTELLTRITACNFLEKDRMLRDKIVLTVTGKLQELLLREESLTLEKTLKICRAFEQSTKQVKELKNNIGSASDSTPSNLNKVSKKSNPKLQDRRTRSNKSSMSKAGNDNLRFDCKYCGYKHERKGEKCPAWDKTCDNCKGLNHFKSKCSKKVHAVVSQSDDHNDPNNDFDEKWLLATNDEETGVTTNLSINNHIVKFQLDSAADVNTIFHKHVGRKQVSPTNIRLNMWNKTNLKPLGETSLTTTKPSDNTQHEVKFLVVPNGFTNFLGLNTIQELGFITINCNAFISKVCTPPLGDLGMASLRVNESVSPKVLPCRKVPLAIENDVKQELDRPVSKGVLEPVTEPIKWVSQMAIVHKNNGKLRICIDPQPLNSALQREHYQLPVLDDLFPKLKNAKVFSKLDVKEAYWHVRLDEQSSKLTTMITPFGRYRWKRLPFGLKVSSEIFQRKIDEALEDFYGVFNIVDDIIIVGCGATESEALADNNQNLSKSIQRCKERNITLNEDKQETGLKDITFHGHKITRNGIEVDKAKVKAIVDRPAPTDVEGNAKKNSALSRKKLSESACLAYFDPSKEIVIQVDSSQHGIGAVLLQDGRPIEYASLALTISERNLAQIEKEALVVLYGLECFDQYTYSRAVTGSEPHLADTLSRAHLNSNGHNHDNRARIMNIIFGNISDAHLEEIQEATKKDNGLQDVMELVMNGWPDGKRNIPPSAFPSFDIRDTLSAADGVLLKGEAIVIPQSFSSRIRKRLHSSHLGADSMLRRARSSVFWPRMVSDIKQLADSCEACQEMKPKNQHEPLKQHKEGDEPWKKIGHDIFQIADKYYLVTVDYYSTFIEVDLLSTQTGTRVINLLKSHFSRYRIPRMIVSDGGSQFSSFEFDLFAKAWHIIHLTSSPMHQQANGKAEAAVKSMKKLLIKTHKEGSDPLEALLEHRNTPRQDVGLSPAELMFKRKTRSLIPSFNKHSSNDPIEVRRQARKGTVQKSHDRKAKSLPELDVGQHIFFQHLEGRD
ncbi:Retrovirus-related Pol polyprotein [Stylophora pistillata]|uniref:Retrovirus-related Pol polyprotein n=1 Tax=Stylophora pistillata TaxID=50429 RepID=A0A2B4R3A5_STYPI|nr:Retrovirus-related Pol polyprotein [Stylophora pistillata]